MTVALFTDLQCSTCDTYQLETVDPLISEYARGSEVRFEFHNYSLGQAEVTQAAYAATAAGEQDVEWQFADLFFRNQDEAPNGTVTDEFLDDLGNAIDSFSTLNVSQWHQDMDSPQVEGLDRRRPEARRAVRPARRSPVDDRRRPGRHEGAAGRAIEGAGRCRGRRGQRLLTSFSRPLE